MQQMPKSGDDMLNRIALLERSNRRLRAGFVASALAAGTVLLAGSAGSSQQGGTQREVRTQRLVIVGADNQPRLMLQGSGDGSSLFLYGPDKPQETGDGEGQAGGSGVSGGFSTLAPRMRFMVEGDDCKIELLQPGGTPRAILQLTADGPALQFLDESGKPVDGEAADPGE